MTTDPGSIALCVRLRNEWPLLRGLIETLEGAVDELWVLDDCSEIPPPPDIRASGVPVTVLRAEEWSCSSGSFEEGRQRDRLLQEVKRHSACRWALQLDADERLADASLLRPLTASAGADGYLLPLVDFYITPDDCDDTDETHPESVRSMFGIETRWTLCLYRLLPELYVPRGDVREPQGLRGGRVMRADAPLVEHFGKSVSAEEWERKVEFYVEHYPEYREKWRARRGQAVHEGISDFGSPLVRRGDPAYHPRGAPQIHAYECEPGWRAPVKAVIRGRLGAFANRIRVRRLVL